jgi:hypothetical protein
VGPVPETLFWNLVPDMDENPNSLFLVSTGRFVTSNEVQFPHEDRTVRLYPTLLCRVLRVEGLDGDLQGAQWHNSWNMGALSMFIGHSYPLLLDMPQSDHDHNGLPFLK